MALREKGRIVIPRKGNKLTRAQKEARTRARAIYKLGEPEYDRMKLLIESLSSVKQADKAVVDGLIMGLLQQNLTNNEIRAVHKFGNSRINRIRKLMANPSLLKSKRPRPVHAVTNEDLDNLRHHLETFDTEDGYPCAHRGPLLRKL